MGVKRIRDESEYKSGGNSDFIGLDEGEKFVGHFLGQADPKIDDPAFFPYKMHWNGKTSVPCADEDCIYCDEGEKPRSKAYTLWLVTIDEAGKKLGKPAGSGELRIFDMPVTVIKQFNEMRAEGDKVQGKEFRVSRPDEKTYVLVPKDTKPLTKTQISELVKSDDAPDFEEMLNNKLKKAMAGTAVQRVLEDGDDDERPAKSGDKASKKGKGKAAPEPDDDDTETETEPGEWPDEGLEEEVVTVAKKPKKDEKVEVESESYEGTMLVWTNDDIDFDLTDLSKGDKVKVSTGAKDEDGDYVLTEEPEPVEEEEPEPEEAEAETGDAPDGNGLPDEISGAEMTVKEVDANNFTMEVEDDELEFTLYFLDTVKIDFDDFEVGDKIIVNAEKDRAGDLVTTEVPDKVEAKKKPAAKKGGKKTTGKKKGK